MGNGNRTLSNLMIDKAKRDIPKQDQIEYQPQEEGLGKCENWIYYQYQDVKILVEFWSKTNSIRKRIEDDGKTYYNWGCCNCHNKIHPDRCVKNNKQSILHY